jgi:hypothetical protein
MSSLRRALLAAFLISVVCGAPRAAPLNVDLAPRALLGGRVSVLIPSVFQPMSQELLLRKYSRPNPPSLVYANEATTVSIAFDHTPHRLTPSQLGAGLAEMKKGMLQAAPTATFFRSELMTIHGRQFAVMDLRTPGADGVEIRNILAATSLDDRLLVISFNCTQPLEAAWLETGNKIIQSITIK